MTRPTPPTVVTEERTIDNSDPLTHTDVTDSSNLLPVSNNTLSDAVALPLISAKDYFDDLEFSGMYQYLFDGTLSGTAKKDKQFY